jgi:hypothetical protein
VEDIIFLKISFFLFILSSVGMSAPGSSSVEGHELESMFCLP